MEKQEVVQPTRVTTLGRYQVVRRIGRGGMGEVWLCDDPRLGRQVAIKTLPVHGQQDQEFVQRFEQEARSAAALTHPHILEVHDYGKEVLPDGSLIPFLVMPYIQGSSLGSHLKARQGRFLPWEALTFLKQAAEAIDHAHKRGIIHRDIKPDNMLLRNEHWLLLADFGIARILTTDERVTKSSFGVGTPEYIAPEQAQGQATITSDNYSLAVIAFQLFTDQLPFEGETALATIMQHMTQPPPSPRELNADLPPAFEQVLLQGLEKDPNKRPALASEFVQQLELALSDPTFVFRGLGTLREHPELAFHEALSPDSTAVEKGKRGWSRRQILFGGASGAAILAGVGLGAWGYVSNIVGTGLPDLLPPPALSARPPSTGPDKPVLILTGGHNRRVWGMDWSPDSQILVTTGFDGYVLRWNISDIMRRPDRAPGKPLYEAISPPYPSAQMIPLWSPDGKMLALLNTDWGQKGVQVQFCQPNLNVASQFWIPGNDYLLIGASWLSNTQLVLVHRESYTADLQPTTYTVYVVDTRMPQKPTIIFTKKDDDVNSNAVIAYNAGHSALRAFVHGRSIEVGAFSLSGGVNWKPQASFAVPPYDNSFEGPTVSTALWASDGKHIIVSADGQDSADKQLFFYNWQESHPRRQALKYPGPDANGNKLYIRCMSSNPASITPALAIGGDAGQVYLWNLQEGGAPVQLNTLGRTSAISFISWSPDGKWLAVAVEDRELSIFIWKI